MGFISHQSFKTYSTILLANSIVRVLKLKDKHLINNNLLQRKGCMIKIVNEPGEKYISKESPF
ncbi:hypothetical protein NEOC84_000243|nr:hypothetical protein [Neochlamydia sp. AcF95]NGY94373.1 hypothetical protein [Neochlamydia sp. AcF84]